MALFDNVTFKDTLTLSWTGHTVLPLLFDLTSFAILRHAQLMEPMPDQVASTVRVLGIHNRYSVHTTYKPLYGAPNMPIAAEFAAEAMYHNTPIQCLLCQPRGALPPDVLACQIVGEYFSINTAKAPHGLRFSIQFRRLAIAELLTDMKDDVTNPLLHWILTTIDPRRSEECTTELHNAALVFLDPTMSPKSGEKQYNDKS